MDETPCIRYTKKCLGCGKAFPSSYFRSHVLKRCKKLSRFTESTRFDIFKNAKNIANSNSQLGNSQKNSQTDQPLDNSLDDNDTFAQLEVSHRENEDSLLATLKNIFLLGRDDRFGTAPKRNVNSLRNDETHLNAMFKLVPVKNSSELFDIDLWRHFFAGNGLAKSTVANKDKTVHYATQYGRIMTMFRFFGMFEDRDDLLEMEKAVRMGKFLNEGLKLFNKGRVIQMAQSRDKQSAEQSSVALGIDFAKFVSKLIDDMVDVPPLRLYIVDIFITINSYAGTRPSGLSYLTLQEWANRQEAANEEYKGWVQVQASGMKNAVQMTPHVSIDPITAKKIDHFVQALRPKNAGPYLFVTSKTSVRPLIPAYASLIINHKLYGQWRNLMKKKFPKLPDRFRFNTQRHCIQTETRLFKIFKI